MKNEFNKFEPKEGILYINKRSGKTWQLNWLDVKDNECVMISYSLGLSGILKPLTKRINLKNFNKNWELKYKTI